MATPPNPSRRLPLAITGGIASGKSTVLAHLDELGLRTWSADSAVRDAYRDPVTRERIREALGGIDPDDRGAARSVVLEDAHTRRRLNRVLHPVVVEALDREMPDACEIPLLIEACLQDRFERVWLVSCPDAIRIQRLEDRGIEPKQAQKLLEIQLPDRAKAPFAESVIRTDQHIGSVHRTVARLVTQARLAGLG